MLLKCDGSVYPKCDAQAGKHVGARLHFGASAVDLPACSNALYLVLHCTSNGSH